MNLERVTAGRNVPHDVNVIIEIPMNADPVKYEVDKQTGAVFVDRFMSTAMHYPCNYGYLPPHPPCAAARRRLSGGRARGLAVPPDCRGGGALPPGRHAAHEGRGGRGHQAAGGAD